jgi:hypothetical protein
VRFPPKIGSGAQLPAKIEASEERPDAAGLSPNRVVDQIHAWREDLINLNRNNRLLYFRKTKSSTLELLQPSVGELLARLSNGTGITFWEPVEDQEPIASESEFKAQSRATSLFEDMPPPNPIAGDLTRQRTRRAGSDRSGKIVCDVAARDQLQKTLRWLERRSAQEFMDKGLWILYLAVGILDWIEPPRDTAPSEHVSSPIMLFPVRLHRDSSQVPYRLHSAEEDPAINPALAFKLQHDFGLTLPGVDQYETDDIESVLNAVREVIAAQPEWAVRNTVVLSVFSFHKEVMYRDLQNNEAAVGAHPIVQNLALGHRSEKTFAFDPPPEHDLDERHPPESMIAILDCDASQRQCLVAAAVGHSFVMEGPPGTGKSQTIANMIADAIGRGRTVLFVSEKAAALEVVYRRLQDAGLSEYVLELHSHKATRKQVAQTLGRSLTTRLTAVRGMPELELQQLMQCRRQLTAYAIATNERRESLGKSLYEVLAELSPLQHLPQAPVSDAIHANLTAAELATIYHAVDALGRAWGPVARGEDFLWRSLVDGTLTQARRASLLLTLDRAVRVLEELKTGTKALASDTALPWRTSIADTRRFRRLVMLLAVQRPVPQTWLTVDSLHSVNARVRTLGDAASRLRTLETEIETAAGPQWRALRHEGQSTLEDSLAAFSRSAIGWLMPDVIGLGTVTVLGAYLRELALLLRRGLASAAELHQALAAPMPQTVGELRSLFQLAACVRAPHKPPSTWLDATHLPHVRAAVNTLEPLVRTLTTSTGNVQRLFKVEILNTDVDGLQLRFDQIHRGFGKLRAAYWRDRRLLKSFAKSGKIRREEVTALKDAVECKRHQQELHTAERRHAAVIGTDHYQSLDTDFVAVRAALDTADAVLKLAAGRVDANALAERFSNRAPRAADIAHLLAGPESWADQLTTMLASYGHDFEHSMSARGVTEVIGDCDSTARAAERIEVVLSDIVQSLGVADVSVERAVEWLRIRRQVADLEHSISKDEASDREVLGSQYAGHATDFDALSRDLDWAEQVRHVVGGPLPAAAVNDILRLDVDQHRPFCGVLDDWSHLEATILDQFVSDYRGDMAAEFQMPFDEVKALLRALSASIDDIAEWGGHAMARSHLSAVGLADAVTFCIQKRVSASEATAVLRRSVLESWVDAVRKSDPRLQMFSAKDRDDIVAKFRQLDRQLVSLGAAAVIQTCNAKRPTLVAGAAALIATEANKQKRHMPVRRLIEQAGPVVQALKPCMMMSPLSVSQFLPSTMRYDLVIFDEASQVKPADAINCIYRGQQLVIAGDQKQLPPTPFFDKLDSDSGDEWSEEQLEDFESILDVAKGSGGLQSIALRWHYRSQHEDLITYSNYRFYDGRLVTFPSANIHSPDLGVEMFVVPGIYRRGGARDNPVEAGKVVERVLFHLKHHPQLSIGVVAFSEAQASTIENEIVRQSDKYPELRIMLDGDRLHGGFVKNLETVQGDERDVIIFSIGYGRDEAGRFTLNFGPLNKAGGHRRLNVAITRARRRVEVVSSVDATDFVGDLRSDGVRHLQHYLRFATSSNRLAELAVDVSPDGRDCESPFEEEVARVIRSWGYDVVPQVGCADYRIDLAVKHPARAGQFALGVECDGAMYHSSRVARDRDRLRQEVLGRLGWAYLHRIWGLSWYWNRGQEEARLRQAIQRAIESGDSATVTTAPEAPRPELVDVKLRENPEWTVPYQVVLPEPPRTAAEMHEGAAQGDLQRMIVEVVRGEGPVATEVVLRRVRAQWGMHRAGNRARSAFDTAVRSLRRRDQVVSVSDGFLALSSQSTPIVRSGDRSNPESIRTIEEIPPVELQEAVVRFVREVHVISEDELTARISAVFGWSRRGPDIASEFRKTVRRLVRAGVLKRNGDLLTGDQ